MLTPAPLESARFALRTFRATPETVDTAQLFDELRTQGADLAILRVRPGAADAVRALARYGLAPIHADTLVAWRCALRDIDPAPAAADGFTIEAAREADREAIDTLIDTVFARYPSHYTANPLLAREDVVAGYREWALSHLHREHRLTWLARADGRVAAIACSAFDPVTGQCQGVLHGVHPDFARGGIYTALIRHTQAYFRELGCSQLEIQTQAWNIPVQRVWAREGFALTDVYETFHVNALLDPAHRLIGTVELRFADAGSGRDPAAAILQATMDVAGSTGSATQADPNPTATVSVFGRLCTGDVHSLQIRAYDRRDCSIRRVRVGALYDANQQMCALAYVTRCATP